MKRIKPIFLLAFLFCIIFNSCFKFKVKGKKSNSKLVEEFYVSENTFQYFIKPLKFESLNNKKEFLDLDFTLRKKNDTILNVTLNFSEYTLLKPSAIDSFKIKNDSIEFVLVSPKQLFAEKYNNIYKSRYSAVLKSKELILFLKNNNITLTSNRKETKNSYKTYKKSKSKLEKIYSILFYL